MHWPVKFAELTANYASKFFEIPDQITAPEVKLIKNKQSKR
jgi:hypothetical protein